MDTDEKDLLLIHPLAQIDNGPVTWGSHQPLKHGTLSLKVRWFKRIDRFANLKMH